MLWFKCRGCEAKDKEIAHLLAEMGRLHEHLDRSQARIAEASNPGVERRIAVAPPGEKKEPPPARRLSVTFPGYAPEPPAPTVVAERP